MTEDRRATGYIAVRAIAGLLLLATPGTLLAESGDAAHEELSSQGFPWYDAQRDKYRPIRPQTVEPTESEGELPDAGIPVAQLIMWILLGTIIAIAVYSLVRWFVERQSAEQVTSVESASMLEVDRLEALPEGARQVRDLLGQARQLADQRRYNEAIVFLYGWQLVQLDRQGSIELQKGKTNHQYVDEAATSRPEINQIFTSSTRLFEDAYFGSLQIAESAFRAIWDHNHIFEAAGHRGGSR